MAWTSKMKPHRNYLDPPPNSIAYNAVIYPKTAEETEKNFKNPLMGSRSYQKSSFTFKKNILEGKDLFGDFCYPCHGLKGVGDGPVVGKYPRPPDITKSPYTERGDGFFFYIITFGRSIMPAYGHAISYQERWQIILYLRTLQGKL